MDVYVDNTNCTYSYHLNTVICCESDGELVRTFIVTRELCPIESLRVGLRPRNAPETKLSPLNRQIPGTNFRLSGDNA